MFTFDCPCCGFELRQLDLLKCRCAVCGEILDNEELVQNLVDETNSSGDFYPNVEGGLYERPRYISGAVARR